MPAGRYPPSRYVALLALAAALAAAVAVVAASLGGSEGGRPALGPAPKRAGAPTRTEPRDGAAAARTYVVKPGDNFIRISGKTGVPVETLQELNPDLDPQTLVSGQKLKLKE